VRTDTRQRIKWSTSVPVLVPENAFGGVGPFKPSIDLDVALPLHEPHCESLHRHEDFGQQYARAREHQMQLRADELLEIADNASNDWMGVETTSGRIVRVLDREHLERSEIRIKTRQWLMARYAPKVFGKRLTLTDADGGSVQNLGSQTNKDRYAGAVKLMERIRVRLREAEASEEVSDPEFGDRKDRG
jgi:hypothetical protein